MQKPVYLDHHATTPVDPRVLDSMLPFFGPKFGNAASRTHSFGWEAEKAVEAARRRIAELAGAEPREIVFTSGATESDNLAIKGAMEACRARGNHVVTVATEHPAVLDVVRHLEKQGCQATVLPPGDDGLLDLSRLREAIRPATVLVSVMYANNEIGVVQPVPEIGAICRERGVLFHCDAAQAFGKIPIDVEADRIDLMSLSAGARRAWRWRRRWMAAATNPASVRERSMFRPSWVLALPAPLPAPRWPKRQPVRAPCATRCWPNWKPRWTMSW